MSEFSNETTGQALRIAGNSIEKTTDAIFKILKYLMNRKERALKNEQYKEMKIKSVERSAKLKIAGKVGYVKAKLLQRTGERLAVINMTFTDEQLGRFAEKAKKYGLLCTSVSDQRQTGEKIHTIFVLEKDLSKAKFITDEMVREQRIKPLQDKINEINKKDVLTEQDKKDLDSLKKQIESIEHGDVVTFNEENANIIFEDACGMLENQALSFDESLNHFTDRNYARDTPYYLCERTNPSSYIELKSTRDNYDGKDYTRTDYKVFKNGTEQKPDSNTYPDGFTDKRFDGRPQYYWPNLRGNMMQAGNFSNDVVIFDNKNDFLRYQQLYKEQQKREIEPLQVDSEQRNYADICNKLLTQLDENNVMIGKDGTLLDKETHEALSIDEAATSDKKAIVAESNVILKQYKNYREMGKLEAQISMDRQKIVGLKSDSGDYLSICYCIEENESLLKDKRELEQFLIQERSQINGAQAAAEVEKEHEADETIEQRDNKGLEQNTMPLNQWQEQIDPHHDQSKDNSDVAAKSMDKADKEMKIMSGQRSLSFDESLNHFTDRNYSRDTPYYLCERTNPFSYIELKSTRDNYDGKEYTRIDYKLFRNGTEQKPDLNSYPDGFTDKRFDGRSKYYRHNMKCDMREAGGFSNDIVIFDNRNDFLRYQQLYKEQQKHETEPLQEDAEKRNYADICNQLLSQLDENNVMIGKDGTLLDKDTQKALTIDEVATSDRKAIVAECNVILKQYDNYREMGKLEAQISMDRQEIVGLNSESGNYLSLCYQIDENKSLLNKKKKLEQSLIQERSQINGAQAAAEVEKEHDADETIEQRENEGLEQNTIPLNDWKEQIDQHPDRIVDNGKTAAKSMDKASDTVHKGDER